jgi:hypothetical protein
MMKVENSNRMTFSFSRKTAPQSYLVKIFKEREGLDCRIFYGIIPTFSCT